MPGWRDAAEIEDIDGYAQHVANNEGQREYAEAYDAASKLKAKGKSLGEVKEVLIREPPDPPSGNDAMTHRKSHAAGKQLAAIRR